MENTSATSSMCLCEVEKTGSGNYSKYRTGIGKQHEHPESTHGRVAVPIINHPTTRRMKNEHQVARQENDDYSVCG